MNEIEIDKEKKVLRAEIKKRVKNMDDGYRKESDRKIAENILSLGEYAAAKTVFCFVSTSAEINTRPIIEDAIAAGKTVCVPRCEDEPGIMELFKIRSYDDLEAGKWDILEPKKNCPEVMPGQIDFAVIPCASCSSDGRRLGYGGGYYDRYLENAKYPCAIICRETLMSEDIPVDEHDIEFSLIVTDRKISRIPK